jgi:hypothetical protein
MTLYTVFNLCDILKINIKSETITIDQETSEV